VEQHIQMAALRLYEGVVSSKNKETTDERGCEYVNIMLAFIREIIIIIIK